MGHPWGRRCGRGSARTLPGGQSHMPLSGNVLEQQLGHEAIDGRFKLPCCLAIVVEVDVEDSRLTDEFLDGLGESFAVFAHKRTSSFVSAPHGHASCWAVGEDGPGEVTRRTRSHVSCALTGSVCRTTASSHNNLVAGLKRASATCVLGGVAGCGEVGAPAVGPCAQPSEPRARRLLRALPSDSATSCRAGWAKPAAVGRSGTMPAEGRAVIITGDGHGAPTVDRDHRGGSAPWCPPYRGRRSVIEVEVAEFIEADHTSHRRVRCAQRPDLLHDNRECVEVRQIKCTAASTWSVVAPFGLIGEERGHGVTSASLPPSGHPAASALRGRSRHPCFSARVRRGLGRASTGRQPIGGPTAWIL